MKVRLITYTNNPEKIITYAAKLCYSSSSIDELYENLDEQKSKKFLDMLTDLGHQSPIEHVSFTFGIEGVSRSLLAQLTRHRIASFSVQSQRYVDENDFSYTIPPEIKDDKEAKKIFIESMENSLSAYRKLSGILKKKHKEAILKENIDEKKAENLSQKKAIEDARFVLPNACNTKLILTMNARSLFNFFTLRCCSRAQWEIRNLSNEMLRIVYPIAPTLFKNAGPSCIRGKCNEGRMSCMKMEEVKEEFVCIKNGTYK